MVTYYVYDENGVYIGEMQVDAMAPAPQRSTLTAPDASLVKPVRVGREWVEGEPST